MTTLMKKETILEKDVAATILAQVTPHVLRSLGATEFMYGDDQVQFCVKRRDFTKVVIKLNASDAYDIELWDSRLLDHYPFIINKKIDEYNDVYCDQLADLLMREADHH